MSRRKRSSRSEAHHQPARLPRRTKRLKRRLLVLALLLVGIVAALPTLVGSTALRDNLLARALPNGYTIQSDTASLGWASGQSLSGVKIVDPDGNPLLSVESATLPRSLIALALNQSDLGKIEIVRPTAYVATRADGSNWEDFAAGLLQQPDAPQSSSEAKSSSNTPTLDLEIVEGTVLGWDRVTNRKWSLESANVSAELGAKIQASGSAQLATEQSPQRGQIQFRWQPSEGGQHVEILAERLPLEPLEPWLARFVTGTQLSGGLSTDATVTWSVDPQQGLTMQTTGRLEVSQFDLSADALAGDRLHSQQLRAPWKLQVINNELAVEQLDIHADWAKLSATGSMTLAELQSLGLENLPRRPMKLLGSADIAQLARQFPRTLQLREGVRIDAGQLSFEVEAQPEGERYTWLTNAELANVAGTDGQRQIRWNDPIQLAAKFSRTAQDTKLGPQLETLSLDAPFANASVQTDREAITGEFEIDFEKLSQELGQFVDVRAWQLRGLGEGTFDLKRQANQQFIASASVDLTDLHVAEAGRDWSEPKLQIELQATGAEENLTPRSLASGRVQLRGPRDQFDLTLLQPVELGAAEPTWQLQLTGHGPLELWASRLRPWLATMPQQLAGDAQVDAKVQVGGALVQVLQSTGSVAQLRLQSDTMSIDEPRIEFAGDAAWNRTTDSVNSQELQLLGSSFSFRARDIAMAMGQDVPPTARGNIAFRGDLERLASMAGLVGHPTSTWPRGTAVGQLQLATNAEEVLADFGMQVEQLELARTTAAGAVYGQPEIVWREPRLEITGVAKYELAADRVQLDNLQLRGQTLQLKSSASVEQLRTAGNLQASGLVEYDPQQLAKLIASYAGQGVQLDGDRQVRFQIAGSLFDSTAHWSQRWNAAAEAGWSSAGVFGLPLGGGRLQAALRDGQMQIAPLDVAVGQGRFTAAPRVLLTPGAEQIVLPTGPLVTNVDISQEVSETMLKYVAPILAGATRAEGQFSIDLDQAEIPLAQPAAARVQGRLTAHRLNVSPGPMVQQLATLVDQIESLTKRKQFLQAATAPKTKVFLTMNPQPVDFQLVNGRVYHRNLEFLVDDVPVRSYGSVGFDQSLALVLEVPIQDKWIESEPALRGFAGKSLQLPMQGTFQKPRIDQRAVADLSKQLLQGAATQAIGDELNRQFEKLFRGK